MPVVSARCEREMATESETDAFVQDLFRTTARSFFEAKAPLDWLETRADETYTHAEDYLWNEVVDMGWTGITFPEEVGGAGLRFSDQVFLFEELGRALYPGPYFSNFALAAPGIEHDAHLTEQLISGEKTFTLAWAEPGSDRLINGDAAVLCRAEPAGADWQLFGTKVAVPDAALVTNAVVLAQNQDGFGIYLIDLAGSGVTIVPIRGIDGTRREYEIVMDGVAATMLATPDQTPAILTEISRRSRLAASFEALGIAERVLADIVQYASSREQFGKPIGAFQAVSGPLADCFVAIQLARALADWAVQAYEQGDQAADMAIAAAKASACEAASKTVERAIQVAGAIGFTWEYHLHRFLRRSIWLECFEGTSTTLRAKVADALLDMKSPIKTVELLDSSAAGKFRADVREWIKQNLGNAGSGIDLISSLESYEERKRQWRVSMCETGNLVAHWPVEYGGKGLSDVYTAIFREEAIKAHPRVSHGDCGVDLVAPLLMRYGTDSQRERFLEPIRMESEIWTQGFSEPNAGSDLAALQTRAVKDGPNWIVNGNKVWATYSPVADWIFVLARTDPEAKRHRGISCFLVDAKSPGIEIRPIRDISGEWEFGEIFFTDVQVPDSNMLGGVNEGWGVAVMTLAHERVIESYEDIGELGFVFDRLLDGYRLMEGLAAESSATGSVGANPLVRDQIAKLWSQLQAVRLVQYRCVLALEHSDTPPSESEIVKLVWSEVAQDVAKLGLELFATSNTNSTGMTNNAEYWQWNNLVARSLTIYAGTSEIIKSVVAERVLGLPRSR